MSKYKTNYKDVDDDDYKIDFAAINTGLEGLDIAQALKYDGPVYDLSEYEKPKDKEKSEQKVRESSAKVEAVKQEVKRNLSTQKKALLLYGPRQGGITFSCSNPKHPTFQNTIVKYKVVKGEGFSHITQKTGVDGIEMLQANTHKGWGSDLRKKNQNSQ